MSKYADLVSATDSVAAKHPEDMIALSSETLQVVLVARDSTLFQKKLAEISDTLHKDDVLVILGGDHLTGRSMKEWMFFKFGLNRV